MIEKPHLAETTARLTAIIHFTIPREEMPQVFGPAVGELMAGLAAQGLAPAGPVFAHHLKMSPGMFDFELGVPVGAPMAATGRILPGHWPALKVAITVHHGPYRRSPRRLGRVHGLDRSQRPRAGGGPLGMLCRSSGLIFRPRQLAHGANSTTRQIAKSGAPS